MSDRTLYMDTAHFRHKLLQARRELTELQGVRNDAAATVKLDQTSVGRLSRMDAMQQQAMARSLGERATRSLQQIDAALRRCDENRYGMCLKCDEPIDPRRLELNPAVTRCMDCAQ